MVADRVIPPAQGDERAVLVGWLDWQRATVHQKCAGLSDADAYNRPIPAAPLSIASVVAHLRWVEWHWFERSFLGAAPAYDDHRSGWDIGDLPLADLLAAYATQCDRSREIVDDHDLDALESYAPEGLERVSLRWIVGHMVEETARHLGHLDLLREATDGSRGY